ncbi:Alpha-L-fucosidase [Mucilaginibacter gotjawali]|uniref:Alpha-L-fucosidase n=1 Tax=Mucilaginibacter gotjawali TaxID=1550579 RepID=A0A0X8X0Y5_9SPHI|nr:alpha-L-fucosidase [Mucilaginibacter gotjawali]BAU53789.1 Alpha-L-fucosidase [Mucilaginibacter gotjawali]
MKKLLFSILLLPLHIVVAQQHQMSKSYVVPDDTLVQQKLGKWQDLKFGLFMHWGTYSQWGW